MHCSVHCYGGKKYSNRADTKGAQLIQKNTINCSNIITIVANHGYNKSSLAKTVTQNRSYAYNYCIFFLRGMYCILHFSECKHWVIIWVIWLSYFNMLALFVTFVIVFGVLFTWALRPVYHERAFFFIPSQRVLHAGIPFKFIGCNGSTDTATWSNVTYVGVWPQIKSVFIHMHACYISMSGCVCAAAQQHLPSRDTEKMPCPLYMCPCSSTRAPTG